MNAASARHIPQTETNIQEEGSQLSQKAEQSQRPKFRIEELREMHGEQIDEMMERFTQHSLPDHLDS